MQQTRDAFELAQAMVEIGVNMGRKCVAIVSDMDQPLGRAVGNAVEVQEAIAALRGEGPDDLMHLCLELGAHMLVLGDMAQNTSKAKTQLKNAVASGAALEKLRKLVEAQGGDPKQVDAPESLPTASHVQELLADESGYVQSLEAITVGRASMQLGAGRETKTSQIDLGAGIWLEKKVGDRVEKGEVLAKLLTNDGQRMDAAVEELRSAYVIGENTPEKRPLIHGSVIPD